jgi:hypothetical protein
MFDFCSSISASSDGHHLDALVVVVDGDRERALGVVLADHVLVEDVVDLARLRQVLEMSNARRGDELLVDDLVAEIDALVADVDAGAGDQLLDLALGLAAEAAQELLVGVGRSAISAPPRSPGSMLAAIPGR